MRFLEGGLGEYRWVSVSRLPAVLFGARALHRARYAATAGIAGPPCKGANHDGAAHLARARFDFALAASFPLTTVPR